MRMQMQMRYQRQIRMLQGWCSIDTMSQETTRLLYLARHAEPDEHGAGLTSIGSLQAEHLGRRLAPLSGGQHHARATPASG